VRFGLIFFFQESELGRINNNNNNNNNNRNHNGNMGNIHSRVGNGATLAWISFRLANQLSFFLSINWNNRFFCNDQMELFPTAFLHCHRNVNQIAEMNFIIIGH